MPLGGKVRGRESDRVAIPYISNVNGSVGTKCSAGVSAIMCCVVYAAKGVVCIVVG